jgi:hypothetical protein
MRTILRICGYSISKEPNHKILVVIASERVRANARPMTAGYDFVISRRDAPELCTKRPLGWDETAMDIEVIWGTRKHVYFCEQDWTGQISLIGLKNFRSARSPSGKGKSRFTSPLGRGRSAEQIG